MEKFFLSFIFFLISISLVSLNSGNMKIWRFTVKANVRPDEIVAVTGDCDPLGNWEIDGIYLLRKQSDLSSFGDTVWSGEVLIPAGRDINYRYCICTINPDIYNQSKSVSSIISVEIHTKPRVIAKESTIEQQPGDANRTEIFGLDINNNMKVGSGPLISDSVAQFILSNNAFISQYSKSSDFQIYIKLYAFPREVDYKSCLLPDERKESELCAPYLSSVLISVLNGKESRFVNQNAMGHLLSNEDFIMFQIRAFSVENLVYVFSFRVKHGSGESKVFGYGHVLLDSKRSLTETVLPIINTDQNYLGQLAVTYLIVRPMADVKSNLDLRQSYRTFWKQSWKGLEIGHRGSGVSFDTCNNNTDIRENTIGSFKNASEYGADMVEFDVQLSKDLVPVIYHDFHILLSALNSKNLDKVTTTKLKFPFHELSSNDLHSLKILHLKEEKCEKLFLNDGNKDYDPFPTLEEIFKAINRFTGFNIEIKYTLEKVDGINELDHPPDMNEYVDRILRTVFRNAGNRYIVFSSFNPDVCTMVQLKQNRYPVLFLTQGVTRKYTSYKDLRSVSIPMAVNFALSSGILGINVHTEDILRDESQVKYVLDNELVLFCWGSDNNDKTIIKRLKNIGLHGIIFDKFSKFTTKESGKSIFEEEEFSLPYTALSSCNEGIINVKFNCSS